MSAHIGNLALEFMEDLETAFDEPVQVEFAVVIVAYRLPDDSTGTAFRTTDAADWKTRGVLADVLYNLTTHDAE